MNRHQEIALYALPFLFVFALGACDMLQCPEGYEWGAGLYCVESGSGHPGQASTGTHKLDAAIGDSCYDDWDCSTDQLCLMQSQGDIQGVCTIPCVDWTDCGSLQIDQAFWDCCDIAFGTAACFPKDWCN